MGLAGLGQGAQTARADLQRNRCSIDRNGCFLNVGLKHAAGVALGEAHIATIHFVFATYLTLSHGLSTLHVRLYLEML